MAKIIVFDLYDTVLKNISFNFDEGLTYLYDNFFSEVCSKIETIKLNCGGNKLWSEKK